MALTSSGRLTVVAMEYHQRRAGWLVNDETWQADDWTRPEFQEDTRSAWARDHVESWLVSWRQGLGHAVWLLQRGAEERAGVLELAHWLDDLLYGGGLARCPRDQWAPVQVVADGMARGDFCRMNFAALAARVRETGMAAEPMT